MKKAIPYICFGIALVAIIMLMNSISQMEETGLKLMSRAHLLYAIIFTISFMIGVSLVMKENK